MFKLFLLLSLLSFVSANQFVHITDIHFDSKYKSGSAANCLIGDDLGTHCCREYSIPKKPYRVANQWGDYNCDTPFLLVNKTLEWIANINPQPDFIIYTGDSPGHHDLTQSIKKNLNSIQAVTEQLYRFKKVYCNIGNHGPWPVDQLGPKPWNQYLTNKCSSLWKRWIPETAYQTLKHGGYYAMYINQTTKTPVKLISLNTLYFDQHNLLIKHSDLNTEGQWDWLNTELKQSELDNEHVWIIGHVFPGNGEATSTFTQGMINLIQQYNKTVRYQFWGHSHDDFHFVYPNNTGVGWITASIMPDQHFPSFRIFDYNPDTMVINDYTQYVANLTYLTETNNLTYYKEYSAKEAYNLVDMESNSWTNLITQMKSNDTLFQNYWSNKKTGYNIPPCDQKCKSDFLHSIQL